MSRSIGDHAAATVGVTAKPQITEYAVTNHYGTPLPCARCEVDSTSRVCVCRYDLRDADQAIVVASDGVWELLSSQNVADIVARSDPENVEKICSSIVEAASAMWKREEGDYRDDITVFVLLLPWCPQQHVP